ncbi:MAG: tRNA-dihydrouridine synthase family protein [Clostridiales bacterium]|nr:tRNA-dihydrouridine synthase family protein [Clostridiales bacterium]
MKIYFAPLEGITGYIFRNAYNEIYGNVDKFFSPFVAPSESSPLTPKERRDLSPENNHGINLVPQILTCRSDHFIEAAKEMQSMGYREVNLNLGCPSGTVCAKGKGAGFLEDTSALQSFLFDIYSFSGSEGMKISIKTRLGYEQPDEFFSLLDIFNEFPVSELIVHPRIRSDFYKGEPRREYFTHALSHAKCPVVYNGNIFTCKDYEDLADALGSLPDPVMLGRGLVSDPSLADKLRGDTSETDMLKFRKLHDTLYHEYQKVMAPDINVLHKMRELWSYWKVLFEGRQENERDFKRLLKAKKYAEYEAVAYRILEG